MRSHATTSNVMPVRPHENGLSLGWFSWKFRNGRGEDSFLLKSVNKIQIWLKSEQKQKQAAHMNTYRGADKSLARPGRKQATATEDFDVHISYL